MGVYKAIETHLLQKSKEYVKDYREWGLILRIAAVVCQYLSGVMYKTFTFRHVSGGDFLFFFFLFLSIRIMYTPNLPSISRERTAGTESLCCSSSNLLLHRVCWGFFFFSLRCAILSKLGTQKIWDRPDIRVELVERFSFTSFTLFNNKKLDQLSNFQIHY